MSDEFFEARHLLNRLNTHASKLPCRPSLATKLELAAIPMVAALPRTPVTGKIRRAAPVA